MRMTTQEKVARVRFNFVLGAVLGLFIGAFFLVGGILAGLMLIPVLVWAARGTTPAAAFGGLSTGIGLGGLGLIGLAQLRCTNTSGPGFSSSCTAPDLTPYLVVGVVLVAVGCLLPFAFSRKRGSHLGE